MGISKFARAHLFAAGITALFAIPVSSHAAVQTLVNDTWLDGTDTDPVATYSENGVDSDGDGDIESAWFFGGAGSLDPVGAGGPERGNLNAGGTSSGSWTTYFTPESSKVTLAQGETLRVTWVFTPSNVNTSNTSQNFRLALANTPDGSRIVGSGAPASAAYAGYAMFMNMGQTLGNSNPFRLMERNAVNSDLLSASGNWTGLANGATSGASGYTSGTQYTFVMDVTHNASDGLDFLVTMTGGNLDTDGVASVAFTDTTPNSFTYDTFAIRPSGATTTAELFDTSLFKVEYTTVPEPASLAACGLALLPLMRLRSK
jgi:hypothetical protein